LHTIILNLAIAHRNNGHKPDNPSWMYRIASFTVAQYWRDYYKRVNELDCGHCSNPQRKRCKEQDLYSECPRAIRVEYLSKPIVDSEGNITELGELIADDKAIDLQAWVEDKTFLLGCPQRLIGIGFATMVAMFAIETINPALLAGSVTIYTFFGNLMEQALA